MTPKQFSDLFDEKYHDSVYQAYPDNKESHAILLNDTKLFCIEQIMEILHSLYERVDKESVSIPASENMESAIDFNYGLETANSIIAKEYAVFKTFYNNNK